MIMDGNHPACIRYLKKEGTRRPYILKKLIVMSFEQNEKQAEIRAELLSHFLNCVKQCQVRYGGKTELASEKDLQVSELCASLEAVLSHGLRVTPVTNNLPTNTLKQVSKLISGRIHLIDGRQVFWHYVLLFLTPHERERYAVLKNINTDIGRGRSWIRGSLNEHTLERYFHYMLEDTQLLGAHYENWALMRDIEKSCMFTNMVAGLNSILFAIKIDNKNLNSSDVETKSFLKNVKNEPIIITKIATDADSRKQKNRKVAKQIITFDDDDDEDNSSYVSISIQEAEDKTSSECCSSDQHSLNSTNTENNTQLSDISEPVECPQIEEELICNDISEEMLSPIEMIVESTMPVTVPETTPESQENGDSESENTIELLKKENETLKSQLKNYISAVQMLHKNRNEALSTLEICSESPVNEVRQYETKLIQVAEMHAELMEFNEYLQQQINFKDLVIERLKKQLHSHQNIDSYNDNAHITGEVFISIPSAFLAGNGSKGSYHVYQIHIRAGNHEWNIFRRYAHFYALHKQLKKLDPVVSKFEFPPKKTIGNKDKALVEKRRKMLEQYLRRLFEHWPELGACTSRAALEQYLAFFREPSRFEETIKLSNNSRSCGSSTSSSDTHYNGL